MNHAFSRRDLLLAAAASAVIGSTSAHAQAKDSFDTLLDEIRANPLEAHAAREDVDGRKMEFESHRGGAPRTARSDRPISDNAIDLLVASEVTSPAYYSRHYEQPTLPPGNSGVTIGMGYDLGWSQRTWIDNEWQELPEATRNRLKIACDKRASVAEPFRAQMQDIHISWDIANAQFKRALLPLYVGLTVKSLPNTEMLSQDCLGALVDLVYNRGAGGFASRRKRYREMVAIRGMMRDAQFDLIPDQLDEMAALWAPSSSTPQPGNVRRRHAEAALFRRGLKSAAGA